MGTSKKEDGYTLIEVLIALTIFAVGLLAVAGMQTSAIRMNSIAGKLTNISTWGMDKIDTGPILVNPVTVEHPVPFKDGYPTQDDRYNTATKFNIKAVFADGLELSKIWSS